MKKLVIVSALALFGTVSFAQTANQETREQIKEDKELKVDEAKHDKNQARQEAKTEVKHVKHVEHKKVQQANMDKKNAKADARRKEENLEK